MATLTDLKDSIVNYGGDEVAEIGDNPESFIEWVNQALVNRHQEVCTLINKWTTSSESFASDGYELTQPTDWDGTSEFLIYTDSERQNDYDDFEMKFGVIRFDSKKTSGLTYYFRYRQSPTVYTAMGDTLLESANPRLKKIIMEDVIAQYLAADNDLESSNAESSAINKANNNS